MAFRRKAVNRGDDVVARYEAGDPAVRQYVDKRLADGVTLEDIRRFGNEIGMDGLD